MQCRLSSRPIPPLQEAFAEGRARLLRLIHGFLPDRVRRSLQPLKRASRLCLAHRPGRGILQLPDNGRDSSLLRVFEGCMRKSWIAIYAPLCYAIWTTVHNRMLTQIRNTADVIHSLPGPESSFAEAAIHGEQRLVFELWLLSRMRELRIAGDTHVMADI